MLARIESDTDSDNSNSSFLKPGQRILRVVAFAKSPVSWDDSGDGSFNNKDFWMI